MVKTIAVVILFKLYTESQFPHYLLTQKLNLIIKIAPSSSSYMHLASLQNLCRILLNPGSRVSQGSEMRWRRRQTRGWKVRMNGGAEYGASVTTLDHACFVHGFVTANIMAIWRRARVRFPIACRQ